jgi:hypothetical protein
MGTIYNDKLYINMKYLRDYLVCFPILVLFVVSKSVAAEVNTNDWGPATNNLQMSIRLDGAEKQIKAGQPFTLSIRYQNISTNEKFIVYKFNGAENDQSYSFLVTSPSGKNVSPDMKKIGESGSGQVLGVNPGQILEIKFNASKLFKLDEVGTYKIIAKKVIMSEARQDEFEVVSNPLDVVVTANQ